MKRQYHVQISCDIEYNLAMKTHLSQRFQFIGRLYNNHDTSEQKYFKIKMSYLLG